MLRLAFLPSAATVACASRPPTPPTEVIEYSIPWPNAFPSDVAVDGDGRVWFTDRIASVIGRFDPERLTFESYRTPTAGPYGILIAPDGAIWYAASNGGSLGRLHPKTGAIEEYTVADRGGPQLIAWAGSTIWFTLRDARAFGRFDTRTREARVLPAPDRRTPYSVAAAPDGSIWMSTLDSYELLQIDPRTNSIRIHDLSAPAPDSVLRRFSDRPDFERLARAARQRGQARRIAVDGKGSVWIADFKRGRIVRYDPRSGAIGEYRALEQRSVYGIAVSRAGDVWYNETSLANIVLLEARTGDSHRVRIPTRHAAVRHIAIDEKRGRVWLPLSDSSRLGRIDWRR